MSNAIEQAIDEYSGDCEKIYIMGDELGTGNANAALSAKYIDPYIKGTEKFMNIKEREIWISNLNKSANLMIGYDKYTKNFSPMCTPKGFCYWVINHTNNYTYIVVDLNGPKGPNILGRDVFAFDIATEYIPAKGHQYITLPHHFYDYQNDYNALCNNTSQSKWNGLTCASKIMTDSWRIPSDYPW